MSSDEKWVLGIVIAGLAVYYPSAIGLYAIAAGLYGRDKLPANVWRRSSAVFGIAMALPVVLVGAFVTYSRVSPTLLLLVGGISAVGTVLSWQRRRMAIIWWHSWPALVMLATLTLVLIALLCERDPLVVILAATTPLFAWYLLRGRLTLLLTGSSKAPTGTGRGFPRASQPALWTYSFIEHLSDHDTMVRSGQGSVVMKVRNAKSLSVLGQAIFEHPPAKDDTIIQFSVSGIGMNVNKLRLEGNYGILEEFEDEDGQLKVSEFPTKSGNTVRFQIRVNGRSMLSDDRDDFGWTPIECPEPLLPENGGLLVELRTNCMGNPGWNWAAWGQLKLVEWK